MNVFSPILETNVVNQIHNMLLLILTSTKIVGVWGAYISSTTFFSKPTMALSSQPPRLFSLVSSCRPHNVSSAASTIITLSAVLCNSARNTLHVCANTALLTYLLTYSAHQYCFKMESRKGPKSIFRGTIQLNPFTKS